MTLTTSVISGRLPFPDDAAPANAYLRFTLSGVDTEGVDVLHPADRVVTLVSGEIPPGFDLWRNTEGDNSTHYAVTLVVISSDNGGALTSERSFPLGVIQVGASAAYNLADLLVAPVNSLSVEAYIAQIMTAASTAETAAAGALASANEALAAGAFTRMTFALLAADTAYSLTAGPGKTVVTPGTSRITVPGIGVYLVAAAAATDHHVTTAGGIKLYVQDTENGFNVKAFGAAGNGVTNDTDAFAAASAALMAAGGGKLVIPFGTYIVGKQTFAGAAGLGYAYRMADIIKIENCTKPVVIEFQGAILRHPNGLRFGAFNPVTGAAHIAALPFVDINYAADVGMMIRCENNSGGVSIVGRAELDGNNTQMIIGGQWGDTGYQRWSYGVWEYNNASFYAENLNLHNFGTDGILCGYTGAVAGGPATPKTLINVTSELNGRQGLSWVGGIGLTAMDCKFNRTGRAINVGLGGPLASSPGAGLDIEAELSVCRNGVFINCEMVNNSNTAMVADSGDSANVTFIGCNFGGTVWPNKPGFKFEKCNFYGQVTSQFASNDPTKATSFEDCLFTDSQFGDYLVPAGLGVMIFASLKSAPTHLRNCTISATRLRPGRLDNFVLTSCRIDLTFPGTTAVANQDFVMILSGAVLQGNVIDANITTNAPADGYSILGVDMAESIGRNLLTNTAGIVRWSSWSTGAGGYVGYLGNSGRAEGVKTGAVALSVFRGQWFSEYLGSVNIYANTAAPTSGTYNRGDRVINQDPAVGQPKGWICTVAGTPGTWVSEGNL